MEKWIIQQTIDFAKPPQRQDDRPYLLMLPGSKKAHEWRVECLVRGEPANLENGVAKAYFLRADGNTAIVDGEIDGNTVIVTLTDACYAVAGGMRGAIMLSVGNTQTVAIADHPYWVQPDVMGGGAVDPGTIPSLPELMAQISALNQATNIAMVSLLCNGLAAITDDTENEAVILHTMALTDEDAYDVAHEIIPDLTEEEWDNFLAAVTDNTSAITQANTNASTALSLAQTAAQISGTTVTLTAGEGDWQESGLNFVQQVVCSVATASNHIIWGIGGAMTSDEEAAIEAAKLVCTAQGAGTLTFTAFGACPTIPLTLSVLGVN